MINPHTHRSRGFGFITFAEEEVAAKVIASGKHTLDDREIDRSRPFQKAESRAEG